VPTVEAVTSNDLDRVLPLLRVHDPRQDDEAWARLISPPWAPGGTNAGWVLLDGDTVVGFLGAVFSERRIGGAERRFCNLTTWYVDPDHRESSLALLRPVTRLRDHTVTDLSPNAAAARISKRLGFTELDTGLVLLGPIGSTDTGRSPVAVHVDEPDATAILPDSARRLAEDHADLPGVHHLVAETSTGALLVIVGRVPGGRRPYSHIHHVSDPDLFRTHHAAVRRALQDGVGVPLIIDARFSWAAGLPNARRLVENSLKLFKPCDDLPTDQIDNLYSELVLLPFSQLPPSAGPLGQRMTARVRRAVEPALTVLRREGATQR